mgnify:FL=1|jgi:hypothetical protein
MVTDITVNMGSGDYETGYYSHLSGIALMFADFRFTDRRDVHLFLRGVARLLGFRARSREIVIRIPSSAR